MKYLIALFLALGISACGMNAGFEAGNPQAPNDPAEASEPSGDDGGDAGGDDAQRLLGTY